MFCCIIHSQSKFRKRLNFTKWANSNFKEPAIDFNTAFCAAEPTRLTDNPGDTAGRIPLENNSVSKKIWPSVIEITFVGIYAETSLWIVSTIGNAVTEPAFLRLLLFPINENVQKTHHLDNLHGLVVGVIIMIMPIRNTVFC